MIGAVQATTTSMAEPMGDQPPWLGLLAACTALFLGSGYLLYGQLLRD